jgi:hypothetical protein
VSSPPASDQVLLLPLGKLDGSVWHYRLSGFLASKLLYLAADVFIAAISYVVASMAKTLRRS